MFPHNHIIKWQIEYENYNNLKNNDNRLKWHIIPVSANHRSENSSGFLAYIRSFHMSESYQFSSKKIDSGHCFIGSVCLPQFNLFGNTESYSEKSSSCMG